MIVSDDSTSAHDDSSDLVLMRVLLLLAVKQAQFMATDDELRDMVDALFSARARP